MKKSLSKILGACAVVLSSSAMANDMSFFITSVGSGNGANLGGLAGADAHCSTLAKAAGSKKMDWKAYLSTSPKFDRSSGTLKVTAGINARDRIGSGPWHNAKGDIVAKNVDDLHKDAKINKQAGLDESGMEINGRGDKPNKHDILTGSDSLGQYSTAGGDTTCQNWTSDGKGSAIVGHHDRKGPTEAWSFVSWNSSHGSRGCGQDDLKKSGGDGLFYCFASR